jgi:hypothetical protein
MKRLTDFCTSKVYFLARILQRIEHVLRGVGEELRVDSTLVTLQHLRLFEQVSDDVGFAAVRRSLK